MKLRTSGFSRAKVEGLSMIPTLAPDETVLIRWGSQVRIGQVVVALRPDRPESLIVKVSVAPEFRSVTVTTAKGLIGVSPVVLWLLTAPVMTGDTAAAVSVTLVRLSVTGVV